MSYSISGNAITLTRGDTFRTRVEICDCDGRPYIPVEGDYLRFAMKERYEDETPLLVKEIPTDSMELVLLPYDTKALPFGTYVYDIQLSDVTGLEVDTVIAKARLKLTEEVT